MIKFLDVHPSGITSKVMPSVCQVPQFAGNCKLLPTPVFLLENPRDRGAWWAAIYGVAQSRTRLKRLSSSSKSLQHSLSFPGDIAVKNPPVSRKLFRRLEVRSLGWEDPLEECMGTLSSILRWRIPWTEEPGRLQVHTVAKSWKQLTATEHTHTQH